MFADWKFTLCLFYLFGKNGSSAELVRIQNLNNFTEIYRLKNVDFILDSYFFILNNTVYLTYGTIISNTTYKSTLLRISGTNYKEIINTTSTGEVFAFFQDDKIFYYGVCGGNTSLLIIDPSTAEIERRFNISWAPFYHNNSTTIAIGNDILYSNDGINFKPLCSRNGMNFNIVQPDQITIVKDEIYVLLFDNGQILIVKCKV